MRRKQHIPVRGLYPIVDVESLERRSISVLEYTRALVAARPRLLQLQGQEEQRARDTLSLLRALRPICHEADCWLFANDRPDLALLAGCDGVHVGQEDLSLAEVRSIAPSLKVGRLDAPISYSSRQRSRRARLRRSSGQSSGPPRRRTPIAWSGSTGSRRRALARSSRRHPTAWRSEGSRSRRAEAIRDRHAVGAVIAALLPDGADVADVSRRARSLTRALGGE